MVSSAAPAARAKRTSARTGVFTVGQKSLSTPAPVLPTYRGQLPFLPAPVWAGCGAGEYALSVSAADLADLNGKCTSCGGALAQAHAGRSLAAMAALPPNTITMLVLRGAGAGGEPPATRAKGRGTSVFVHSRACRVELGAERLARLHRDLATDCVEAPWAPCRRTDDARKIASVGASGMAGASGVFSGLTPTHAAELAQQHLARCGAGVSVDGALVDDATLHMVAAAAETGLQVLVTGGMGEPADVLALLAAGATLVEARFPFELAARGEALDFERGVTLNLRDACYARDARPLVEGLGGGKYSRAYLHHLLAVHEMLAPTLLAKHNAAAYTRWFASLRAHIAARTFESARRAFFERRAELVGMGTPRGTMPL